MRQRRHVLQVSTFPFLAVLLCAMGSLILLLLVIDRRARTVARAKAEQAVARHAAEDAVAAAHRAAELEQRRQALHACLNGEDQEVLAQLRATNGKVAETARGLRGEKALSRKLEAKARADAAGLEREETAIRERLLELSRATAKTQESQKELARLTGDLVSLEKALADLKEARKRDGQKYSLVPYRGRTGDNRRPHYVECTAAGVIFHPDRVRLEGLTMTLGNLRSEVERRVTRRRETAATAREKEETPYLLLLVRPDGIASYYKTLAALEGVKIDFGYECVEADWVLDFPETDSATPQPWMVTGKPASSQRAVPVATTLGPSVAAAVKGARQPPAGFGLTGGDGKEAMAGSSAGGAGSAVAGQGGHAPGFAGGGPSVPSGGTPIARANLGAGAPALGPAGVGTTTGGKPALSGEVPPPPGIALLPPIDGNAGSPGAAVPLRRGTGERGTQGQSADGSMDLSGGTAQATSTGQTGRLSSTAVFANASAASTGTESQAGAAASPTPGRRGQTVSGGDRGNAPRADEGPPPAGNPVLRPVLPEPPADGKPEAPQRPRVFGNRDWVISIECKAEGVVLYPGGGRYPVATLNQTPPGDNPLAKAVRGMIDRRQAMVRPGAPPYRPVLRFLVEPDGLRSYYLAYPVLEPLGVPMTRENVRPEPSDRRP